MSYTRAWTTRVDRVEVFESERAMLPSLGGAVRRTFRELADAITVREVCAAGAHCDTATEALRAARSELVELRARWSAAPDVQLVTQSGATLDQLWVIDPRGIDPTPLTVAAEELRRRNEGRELREVECLEQLRALFQVGWGPNHDEVASALRRAQALGGSTIVDSAELRAYRSLDRIHRAAWLRASDPRVVPLRRRDDDDPN